ncbi:MAG: glycosyltransferase, partial [Candidatus Lokiarchaeota archaeon]
KKFPNKIKLSFNDKNVGIAKNINRLLKLTSSPYIACSDHDDIWDKHKLEKQLFYLKRNPECDICFCDRTVIDSKNNILFKSEYQKRKFTKRISDFNMLFKKQIPYSFNCLFFRNKPKLLNQITPIPNKIIEVDFWLATFLSKLGGKIIYVHQPLVKYRIHLTNLSLNYFWVKKYNLKNLKKLYKKFISIEYIKFRDYQIIIRKFKKYRIKIDDSFLWKNVLMIRILEVSFWLFLFFVSFKRIFLKIKNFFTNSV